MLRPILLMSILLCISTLNAQTLRISGQLKDAETNNNIQGATIILNRVKDSVSLQTTYTDSTGRFDFSGLVPDSFRIKISSVGYEPTERHIRISDINKDLGVIQVGKTSTELTGVVVRSNIPPAVQKGDTIQFNASQFKVNPDATAEELARKIPGITVENGQVKAQGEDVRRVTIDGRELFGDDATAALRNLPAEIIDKIQVFDRLSDQAQLTGFDDGNSSKEINIVTKANMRNGQFGRVFAGYGTDNRYQAGGNSTFLKENRRISLVGNINNVNQQNFSQQDLLGVTSTAGSRGSRGGRGGGDRRGGDGGRNFGGFGGSSNFLVGQQEGINRTSAFGINYSNTLNKTTLTGSYFFNDTKNTTDETAFQQALRSELPNIYDSTISVGYNTNHRLNLRIEHRIDSANQLIITPSISIQNNESERIRGTKSIFAAADRVNHTNNQTTNDRNALNLNNTILWRHNFPKKGRTFSVNLNTSYNNRLSDIFQTTRTFISKDGNSIRDTIQRRYTDQENGGYELSTNIAYTEPLGKNSQLQFNYNPTYSNSNNNKEGYRLDPVSGDYSLFDTTISTLFDNNFLTHNGGVSFRHGDRDRQFSFGANFQSTTLNSEQELPEVLHVRKTFTDVLPNAMFRWGISRNSNIRLMYRTRTNQPSVTQLAAVFDPTDAPFFSIGNPQLEQQYSHILSARYTYTNTKKGILVMGNIFGQGSDNYISNSLFVPSTDSIIGNKQVVLAGQQLTKPMNVEGYRSLRSFFTFAMPVKFIKSNFNLNGGYTYSLLPALINNINNRTRNTTVTLGSVVSSNISEYIDFTVSYSANFSEISNAGDKEANDHYFQHLASAQLNLLNKKGWFFQNDLNNRYYNGLGSDMDQNFYLWNMNIGKKILKDRKGEIKVGVFDLLGQNQSIDRTVNENYIEDSRNVVLQRYFMLTFSYNLRNFGTPAQRTNRRNITERIN